MDTEFERFHPQFGIVTNFSFDIHYISGIVVDVLTTYLKEV